MKRAGVDAGVGLGERVTVIGEAGSLLQALLAIGVHVGPHGIHFALVLQIVDHGVHARHA